MITSKLLPLLIIVGLITGCAESTRVPVTPESFSFPTQTKDTLPSPADETPGAPVDRATPHLSPTASQPGRPTVTSMPDPELVVAQAVTALSARLDVAPEMIEIIRVSTDEFPIQNLGCPSQKGKEPEPVQPAFVTGREIVLAVGDRRYTYRAHGSALVFCKEKP